MPGTAKVPDIAFYLSPLDIGWFCLALVAGWRCRSELDIGIGKPVGTAVYW